MLKKIYFYILTIFCNFSIIFNGFSPSVFAKETANNTKTTANIAGIDKIDSIPEAIGLVLASVLQFIGAFFLILIIYGGFIWMFSRGNKEQVQKAKEIIEAAIIGLFIVFSSYAMTLYIGKILT